MNLVTGATGHIGNVLVRRLVELGKKTRAFILKGDDQSHINDLDIERKEGDVLDLASLVEAMQGVDTVYHLAGIISIMPGRQAQVWKVNVEGTRNVIEAARQAGVRRLVYTSSIHAITRAPQGEVIDETLGFDQNNPYGEYDRSKAAASLEVIKAASQDLDSVIVCPTGVIGPYDFLGSEMGEVLRGASEGRMVFYVDGAYDFVDVRDVVDGIISARERGRCGESYLLSGKKLSVRHLLDMVREATGKSFACLKLPFSLARLAAQITPWYYQQTKTRPRFTPYSLEVLQSNSDISHAKASKELGYQPRTPIETISDTVRWYLNKKRMNKQGAQA